MEWRKARDKIEELQRHFSKFRVEFIDEFNFNGIITHLQNPERERFKGFKIRLFNPGHNHNVYVTGFFGAQIADLLIQAVRQGTNVKIITEHRRPDVEKMHEGGVNVKLNKNIHTRMFVQFEVVNDLIINAILILGSFDFDPIGLGGNRRDAGIITSHPDLVTNAVNYFDTVWEDHHHSRPFVNRNE